MDDCIPVPSRAHILFYSIFIKNLDHFYTFNKQIELQFEFLYLAVDFIFHLQFCHSLGKLRDEPRYYVNAWYPKPCWRVYWRTYRIENGRKGWRRHREKKTTIKPYLKILTASLTPVQWSPDGTESTCLQGFTQPVRVLFSISYHIASRYAHKRSLKAEIVLIRVSISEDGRKKEHGDGSQATRL